MATTGGGFLGLNVASVARSHRRLCSRRRLLHRFPACRGHGVVLVAMYHSGDRETLLAPRCCRQTTWLRSQRKFDGLSQIAWRCPTTHRPIPYSVARGRAPSSRSKGDSDVNICGQLVLSVPSKLIKLIFDRVSYRLLKSLVGIVLFLQTHGTCISSRSGFGS